MAKGIGRRLQVGIAKETSRGTAESAADFYLPIVDFQIDEMSDKVIDEQALGVIEDSIGADVVKEYVDVNSIKGYVTDDSIVLLLLNVLGSLSTSSNGDASGNVYDHVLTVGQSSQHQALSLFVDDPVGGQDYKHALFMLNTLTISVELGKYIEFSGSGRAKKRETATLSPSVAVENRFLPQHMTFKMASAQSGLSGASATTIKGLSLTISQNLEDDDILGDTEPTDFLNKSLMIEGELEALWEGASTFQTDMLAGTKKALRIDLQNTDVTIGTAADPQILIDLYNATIMEVSRPVKINDMIMQSISFRAHYDATDTESIEVTVTNLQTSY
jgi:hypothetical protein